jgi:hypothetical protein
VRVDADQWETTKAAAEQGRKLQSKPTVAAVLVEAERLRTNAVKIREQDPHAQTYEPAEPHVRNMCSRHATRLERELLEANPQATADEIQEARSNGPAEALKEMAWRAEIRERTQREDREAGRNRDKRLARFHREDAERQRVRRIGITPLERVAAAIAAAAVVASSDQVTSFDERVKGVEKDGKPTSSGDLVGWANRVVVRAAKEIEAEVESFSRRDVEREAA